MENPHQCTTHMWWIESCLWGPYRSYQHHLTPCSPVTLPHVSQEELHAVVLKEVPAPGVSLKKRWLAWLFVKDSSWIPPVRLFDITIFAWRSHPHSVEKKNTFFHLRRLKAYLWGFVAQINGWTLLFLSFCIFDSWSLRSNVFNQC